MTQVRLTERGYYEQDRVRALDPALVDLLGVDDEVLSQERRRNDIPDLMKVLQPAFEIGRVGEHGEAGRAIRGIDAGDRERVEILANNALRGRGFLYLRYQRRAFTL